MEYLEEAYGKDNFDLVAGFLMQKILLNNKTYMKIAKKGLARKI